MNQSQIKRLTFVRLAIKGWAFAPRDWLAGMIANAEVEALKLTLHDQAACIDIIQPARDRLESGK